MDLVRKPASSAAATGEITNGAQTIAGPKTLTGLFTPSGGIAGYSNGSVQVPAGAIGQVISSGAGATVPFTASSGVINIAQIQLTFTGIWCITAFVSVSRNGATMGSLDLAALVNASAGLTLANSQLNINYTNPQGAMPATFGVMSLPIPTFHVRFDGTTITVIESGVAFPAGDILYLKAYPGTYTPTPHPNAAGTISARRVS